MYEHRLSRFEQPITIIHPGEYLATDDDIIISTVLGSCVAVALRDESRGVGGLNHFMLPGDFRIAEHFGSQSAKYGMYAMELLINDMLKLGCRRDRLSAKVFGGGSVLGRTEGRANKVPASNIAFAMDFLKTEGIPVLTSDVGGTTARKILFFVRDGKVLLQRITGSLTAAVEIEERDYLERIKRRQEQEGEVTLFS
jgi:chemotaxis protein CheD